MLERRSGSRWVMLASAVSGVPPFYLVTLAAGCLRIRFAEFLAVGTTGRLVHFALVAAAPAAMRGWVA